MQVKSIAKCVYLCVAVLGNILKRTWKALILCILMYSYNKLGIVHCKYMYPRLGGRIHPWF